MNQNLKITDLPDAKGKSNLTYSSQQFVITLNIGENV